MYVMYYYVVTSVTTPVMILVRLIILVKGDYATLFKIRSSRIEFLRGGYKLESITNEVLVVPRKR